LARARKRLSRRELVREDEITSRLERVAVYVVDHPRPILWGIAAVAAIAIAATGWNLYAASRDEGAQSELGELIRTYHDLTTFESDDARYQATLLQATAIDEAYGSLPAGRIARYYAALGHEGLGETEEAVSLLEGLAESSDSAVEPLARFALGQLYKKGGQFDAAIDVYQELLDSGQYARVPLVFELAQLNEAVGRTEEARGYYDSILTNYSGSVYEAEAERALKRLTPADEGA